MKLNLNKVNENPFYGMKNCLKLFQEATKVKITASFLNDCWKEVLDTAGRPNFERKQLFFVLLFSIGDITARQHNIFHKEMFYLVCSNAKYFTEPDILIKLKAHFKFETIIY